MHSRLVHALLVVALALPGGAGAAKLVYLVDTLVAPAGANEGDDLPPGTVVQTGPNALAVVEDRWPIVIEGVTVDCIRTVVFGYGSSYTVQAPARSGPCPLQVADVSAARAGRRSEGTRVASPDGKWDGFQAEPRAVADSRTRWAGFDRQLQDAPRSFTGVVTAVEGSMIRVRSPYSGLQKEFTLNATTLDTPVAAAKLVNYRVRVDYAGSGERPRALKITGS